MREHTISWYESNDGKIFQDASECCEYELNLIYKNSGIDFYIGKEKIQKIDTKDDNAYNEMTDIIIDRSKAEENKTFVDFLYSNYGWCFIKEAFEGDGTHYRFSESPFEPIQRIS